MTTKGEPPPIASCATGARNGSEGSGGLRTGLKSTPTLSARNSICGSSTAWNTLRFVVKRAKYVVGKGPLRLSLWNVSSRVFQRDSVVKTYLVQALTTSSISARRKEDY